MIVVGDVKNDIGDETEELTRLEVKSGVPRWIDQRAPSINYGLVVVIVVSDGVLIVVLGCQLLVVSGELGQGRVDVVPGSAWSDLSFNIWLGALGIEQKLGDIHDG